MTASRRSPRSIALATLPGAPLLLAAMLVTVAGCSRDTTAAAPQAGPSGQPAASPSSAAGAGPRDRPGRGRPNVIAEKATIAALDADRVTFRLADGRTLDVPRLEVVERATGAGRARPPFGRNARGKNADGSPAAAAAASAKTGASANATASPPTLLVAGGEVFLRARIENGKPTRVRVRAADDAPRPAPRGRRKDGSRPERARAGTPGAPAPAAPPAQP